MISPEVEPPGDSSPSLNQGVAICCGGGASGSGDTPGGPRRQTPLFSVDMVLPEVEPPGYSSTSPNQGAASCSGGASGSGDTPMGRGPHTALFNVVMVSPEVEIPRDSSPSLNQGVTSCSGGASGSGDTTKHQTKRKRGRPRRYCPDSALVLASAAPSTSPSDVPPPFSTATDVAETAGEDSTIRRGRLSRASQRRQMEYSGKSDADSPKHGFEAHIIRVKPGLDISAKIVEFSQGSTRVTSVLCANGAISHITLTQPTASGGAVTYQGRFEILTLKGSFLLSEPKNGVECRPIGGLSVSLSGLDGHVFGGAVTGMMTAASTVQIVLSSFRVEEKKDSKIIST